MHTPDHQLLDKQYIWHPFTHMSLWLADDPLVITRGDGVYVFDSEGRRYLDGTASLWCNVHGHRVPAIDDAVRAQLDKIAHTTLLGLANEPAAVLAEKLIAIAPRGLSKVFYSDSGATATEAAFKMAVQLWWNQGRPEKCEFVGIAEGYHGDTVGGMSVGRTTAFHNPYGPMLFKTHFAPAPASSDAPRRQSADATRHAAVAAMRTILERHAGRIAAVSVEPLVMGAAGMLVHPAGYLRDVRALCDEFDVLLIADEVATGFGRTGRMFACDHEGVTPDLMCLGKGITGGYLPLAATLATGRVFDAFLGEPWEGKTFFHGHTYTGNPLACAAAIASIDLFGETDLLVHVNRTADAVARMLDGLRQSPCVGDMRQLGFMVGIDLVADRRTGRPFDPKRRVGAGVCRSVRDHGILLRPLGDTIVMNPPLVTTVEQWRTIVDALRVEIARLEPGGGVRERGDEQVAGDF